MDWRPDMSSIDQTAEPARKIAAKQESLTEGKIVRVGFVGLGHMGAGMAANLLKAGHHVTVFNRTPAKTETLVARGAKAAMSIAEACRGDAVMTMLADDEAVENAVLGPDGV